MRWRIHTTTKKITWPFAMFSTHCVKRGRITRFFYEPVYIKDKTLLHLAGCDVFDQCMKRGRITRFLYEPVYILKKNCTWPFAIFSTHCVKRGRMTRFISFMNQFI